MPNDNDSLLRGIGIFGWSTIAGIFERSMATQNLALKTQEMKSEEFVYLKQIK